MRDAQNRDLSVALYKWYEQHEDPPMITDLDERVEHCKQAWFELDRIIKEHTSSPWAVKLCIGYYEAFCDVSMRKWGLLKEAM